MLPESFAGIVQAAAKVRGDRYVDEEFINQAIERIKDGKENVEKYPTGHPSLKDVYRIALRLQNAALN